MAEQGDTLTVTDGTVTEDCTVLETYTHRGNEFAHVGGDRLMGFVEVPA